MNYSEWGNSDGTKSVSVTIMAVSSAERYICVASQIPGYKVGDNRTAMILLSFIAVLQEATTQKVMKVENTESTRQNEDNRALLSK